MVVEALQVLGKIGSCLSYVICVSILCSCFQNAVKDKKTRGVVYDGARMFDLKTEVRLDSIARKLEADIGSQIAIVTIDSLGQKSIEAFSSELIEGLNLGRADVRDGLLILMANKEKRIRIEVGYGLESIIRDEIAARIIREEVIPRFKAGAYGTGIISAVYQIDSLIRSNSVLIGKEI